MKTISSKAIATGVASLLMVISATAPAFAVGGTTTTTNTGGTNAVCTRVATIMSTNEANLAAHIASMNDNFKARLTKMTADKTAIDQKVITERTNAQNQFEQRITEMEAKSGLTDAQKQAISTFKTNMETAEATREAAVDSARDTYRTALMTQVQNHQQALTSDVNAYQVAVQSAFATATQNCGDGTAITTLRAAVKTARGTLSSQRDSAKIASEIKTLAATRNAAIKAANDAFRSAVSTYTAELTTALGATTSSN